MTGGAAGVRVRRRRSRWRSVARAVLGAGDAMIFVSLIRLVSAWFLVRQAPVVTQMTGQVGQVGAIIAAAPLSYALTQLGWTRAFALASVIGVPLMVAVALLVKDSPYRRTGAGQGQAARPRQQPAAGVGQPRHPAGHVVALHVAVLDDGLHAAVGLPVPGQGPGLSPAAASTLLMVMTGWVVVSGLGSAGWSARLPVLPVLDRDHDRAAMVDRLDASCCCGPSRRRCGCWWCWAA